MKKRRYRATNAKQVNWERVAAQTQVERITFGVDVAKEEFFSVLMKADQGVIETIKMNSITDHRSFLIVSKHPAFFMRKRYRALLRRIREHVRYNLLHCPKVGFYK